MSKYIPTVGVDYGVKALKYDPYELRVNFFDLAGGDEYEEIRNEFYSDAQACLLVYDAADRCSFQRLSLWETDIRRLGPHGMVRLQNLVTGSSFMVRSPAM